MKKIVIPLYRDLVTLHLEYCVHIWRPHLQKDIGKIERVQRQDAKMGGRSQAQNLLGLKGVSLSQTYMADLQ